MNNASALAAFQMEMVVAGGFTYILIAEAAQAVSLKAPDCALLNHIVYIAVD